MKSMIGLCGVVTVLALLGSAVGQDTDEAKKELDRMQGTWRVVSSQVGDEKASADEVAKRSVTVKGDTLIYFPGSDPRDRRGGTIKLNPKAKTLDLMVTFPEAGTML